MTKKLAEGESRPAPNFLISEPKLSDKHADEVDILIQAYFDERGMERAEDEIQEIVDRYCAEKVNKRRLFTQALYVSIVRSFAIVQAKIAGIARFQMNRRLEIEARLAALEDRPTLKYQGVFEVARQYSVGDFVTHDGSLWHCNELTRGPVPGFDPKAWTLAVKRGRDGRGSR